MRPGAYQPAISSSYYLPIMAVSQQLQYMHIVTQLPSGQGIEPGSWRWPTQNKAAWLDENVYIKAAQLTEQAKLDGLFIADTPAITMDISHQPPHHGLDPVVLMALMAKATERIGLIPTLSTSLNEPYTIARVLRSLDLVSRGRMGWNVATTNSPEAQLNYYPGVLTTPTSTPARWKCGRPCCACGAAGRPKPCNRTWNRAYLPIPP